MSACCCRSSRKTETERRIALRSIGPVWDGNEVWLLVAGGATFAAFPEWYASVFCGFYLAFAAAARRADPARHRHRVPRQGGHGRRPARGATARSSSARRCPHCCSVWRSPNFIRGVQMNAGARHDRWLLGPAIAVRAAGRTGHADPVRLPRRRVPGPAHRRRRCATSRAALRPWRSPGHRDRWQWRSCSGPLRCVANGSASCSPR